MRLLEPCHCCCALPLAWLLRPAAAACRCACRCALLLCPAAYPFWPNLSAVAEAALQLPDDEDPGSQEELHGVQVLMQKRRSFMQHAHYQWWSDYGQPGAQLPPQ